jgi:hypothetical protein
MARTVARPPAPRQRQRGQSGTEFVLAFPVLVLLVFGILQVAFLYQGKATLNYATMLAARAGAMHNGDATRMRHALARGLAPMFAGSADTDGYTAALAKATAETNVAAHLSKIEVLSPTAEALEDFGRERMDGEGGKELPNDTLQYRSQAPGSASKVSIQDANLLHVRVTYCHRLIVPVIGRMIHAALNSPANAANAAGGTGMSNPFGIGEASPAAPCGNPRFAGPRIEVRSEAIVRMQSPFYESNIGASGSTTTPPGGPGGGTPTNPGTPGGPADPGDPEVPGVPGVPSC